MYDRKQPRTLGADMLVMNSDELVNRKRWCLARIAELVNVGRREGWLSGAPIANVPASAAPDCAGSISERLMTRLDLIDAEVDALWLLACVDLDPMVACAVSQLFVLNVSSVTLQILERLVALGGDTLDERSIVHLTQLGLLELTTDPHLPRFRRSVRASDRVLALMRNELAIDQEIAHIARLHARAEVFSSAVPVPQAAEVCSTLKTNTDVMVVAHGAEGSGRTTVLCQGYALFGGQLLELDGNALADEEATAVRQLRAFIRECRLHDAAPLVRNLEAFRDRSALLQREVVKPWDGPIFGTSTAPCELRLAKPTVSIHVDLPDAERSTMHWRAALPGAPDAVIRSSGERYCITPKVIAAAATTVLAKHIDRSTITDEDISTALRAQLERGLLGFANRVETKQTWQDLVLPVDQFDLLVEFTARVRHRKQVLEGWGFGRKIGRGHGVSALFSGPPGTGKTMIAGLLANELGLDLYQVDLSRVVSKYIGETEKQLAAVFEAAESGQAIILFDEADSLFGKRTEVKSSNDRYANLEVNYLLQRMEAFKGITILTTNHETAIDEAFKRRLAFHVRVPMPDEEQRRMLWEALIPEEAECAADLDFEPLANEFEMAGGYIKNATVRAAYLAAAEASPISQTHLLRAARAEYEGMGKVAYCPT